MDTFKDQQELDARQQAGDTPWQVWNRPPQIAPAAG